MNKEKFIEELLKLHIEISDIQLEKLEKFNTIFISILVAILLIYNILQLGKYTEFLYFQF